MSPTDLLTLIQACTPDERGWIDVMNETERRIKLLSEALRIFEDRTVAEAWVNEPSFALGGVAPATLLVTDEGLLCCLRDLAAIEHGLPN